MIFLSTNTFRSPDPHCNFMSPTDLKLKSGSGMKMGVHPALTAELCSQSRAASSYIHPLRGLKPYTIYSTEDNALLSQEFIRYSALSCLLISLSRKNASNEEQEESCNTKGIPLRTTTCKPRLLLRPAWCLIPGVHLCLTVGTATHTRTRIS